MDLTTVRSRLEEHSFLDCDDFLENVRVSIVSRQSLECLSFACYAIDYLGVPKRRGLQPSARKRE